MDALKFIEERQRMCKSYYDAEKGHCSDECPAHDVQCTDLDDLSTDAEELVKRVEAWSAAHPRKTRQSVFLEQWPDTQLDKKGNVIICPKQLCRGEEFNKLIAACRGTNCYECRRKFWGKVVQ